jgi:hypothetical protein
VSLPSINGRRGGQDSLARANGHLASKGEGANALDEVRAIKVCYYAFDGILGFRQFTGLNIQYYRTLLRGLL